MSSFFTKRSWLLVLLVGLLFCGGCEPDSRPGEKEVAYFRVPRGGEVGEFFTLPWPNDIRLDEDGTIDLTGFPSNSALVDFYIDLCDREVKGWGTSAGIFFRFSGRLDPASLPRSPAETLVEGATAYLLDIDPMSPDRGARIPVHVVFRNDEKTFIGSHHLVLLPVAGFVMRQGTTYAAILTRGVRDGSGQPLRRDVDLVTVMGANPPEDPDLAAAHAAYAPLREYLSAESMKVTDVLNAAVFTTAAFTSEMVRLREAVYRDMPAPPVVPEDLTYARSRLGYHLYDGTFEGPVYQQGEAPYAAEGGGFRFDAQGEPILARTEPIRFSLSVPTAEMPATGWPVVLYSHGTGGSYRTFVNNGVAADLARIHLDGEVIGHCAVIGIDQVLHGTRCGNADCNPELNFFNFMNPLAARDNVRQGGLDNVQLLRLVRGMNVTSAPVTGQAFRFDPDRIFFMGHSQGGLTGPPFVAVDPEVRLAVLSGAGANMILSLLQKTEPLDIPAAFEVLLAETETPDEYHPVLSLLQLFIEPADPGNYGRNFILEPLPGNEPKHIFVSQGLVDHYTPPDTTEALAIAAGLELVEPWIVPLPRLLLSGQETALARPVGPNLSGGSVAGLLLQYLAWKDADGHFVVFDNPRANQDYRHFIGTYLRDGIPQVGRP